MTYISTTRFLDLADSAGAQYHQLTLANAATNASNVRTGAANNVAAIVAFGASDADLIARLLTAANTTVAQAVTLTKNPVTVWGDLIRALNSADVLGEPGIDAYLTANAIQVGPYFQALFELVMSGQVLTPANVDGARVENL